jgi:hypothetical protein
MAPVARPSSRSKSSRARPTQGRAAGDGARSAGTRRSAADRSLALRILAIRLPLKRTASLDAPTPKSGTCNCNFRVERVTRSSAHNWKWRAWVSAGRPVASIPTEALLPWHPARAPPYRRGLYCDQRGSRTITTGQCACSATRRLTEPSRAPATPPWPCEPTTSSSAPADASIRTAAAWPWTARLSILAGRSSAGRPSTAAARLSLAWRLNDSSEVRERGITPIVPSQAWMASRRLPRTRASSAAHRRARAEDAEPSTPTTIPPPAPLCGAVMMTSRRDLIHTR